MPLMGWVRSPADSIQVTVSDPFHVVILFQPVTLPCTYQFSGNPNAPIVTWKFKSFCRDRIADAFSPASADSQLNAQLAAGNPGYNPYVECQDGVRTVRVVATKQGNSVTLGDYYQGRRVTITDADLVFEQTAWGDSGVYYCSVVSAQDLQGNNEAYAELIVLGEGQEPPGTPGCLLPPLLPCLSVCPSVRPTTLRSVCPGANGTCPPRSPQHTHTHTHTHKTYTESDRRRGWGQGAAPSAPSW
uniref:Immunoglobulin domain-containing protein n=1 Tax=Ornithorhynchus anatinus TaxID=9258 RepID=K7EAL8_ORNAN